MTSFLKPRCPRCGEGKLFASWLALAEECSECHLHLKKQDSPDGPVFFVILIVGFLIFGMAIITEVTIAPPIWFHLVLWAPTTLGLSLFLLRLSKSMLVRLQYKHRPESF